MSGDDDPIWTAQEERAAAALRRALAETSEEWPVHVATSVWVARRPQRRSRWIRLPLAAAAALALVMVSVVAFATWPRTATAPLATSTSIPGHFDDGTFSFDYPTTWRTLSSLYYEGIASTVDIVLGTGGWQTGCYSNSGGGGCTGDKVDLSGWRIVVKIYRRTGGPAPFCGARPTPNGTVGPNSVLASTTASTTTWEIRRAGAEFGWPNNVFIEVHTENPAELASAEALVASFRWAPGVGDPGGCPSPAIASSSLAS